MGIDGITFLDGTLYVNNVFSNNLYRIPVDAAGKAGQPVDIWMDQPVNGPDGMRAANSRLFVAENGSGKISAITVHGDKASVTVVKEGFKTPTGVERAGDSLWIAERGAGKAVLSLCPNSLRRRRVCSHAKEYMCSLIIEERRSRVA
jgi:sugar lactone lactonase YvrE